MMDMDDLGIPDIEPASIFEPDFFDAEDGFGSPSANRASASTRVTVRIPAIPSSPADDDLGLPAPESILDNFGVTLKYDDEACEFDEFLVLGVPTLTNGPSDKDKIKEGESSALSNGTEGEESEEETLPVPSKATNKMGEEAETSVETEKDREDITSGSIKSYGSEPSTPDSRSSSAVIRLSLPSVTRISLGGKKRISISKEDAAPVTASTSAPLAQSKTVSPPRQHRGRLNAPVSKAAAKRKLSDNESDEDNSDDNENEVSEDEDDLFEVITKPTTTRSGRQTRKSRRIQTYEDDAKSDVDSKSGSRKSGRATTNRYADKGTKRAARKMEVEDVKDVLESEADSSDSDIMSPVKVVIKSKYWQDSNGVTYFLDGSGRTTTFKGVKVQLTRMTGEEIKTCRQELLLAVERNATLVEVCIDNFRSAQEAVAGGAKRIELCASLTEGGITPSCGFLSLVKERYQDIPVFVMIRPRGGDFLYSPEELEVMARDIAEHKKFGADGFVFGILTAEGEIDAAACKQLLDVAHPLPCTFHRAFDKVNDPVAALETVIDLGFARILTSGLAASAHAGIPTLTRLVEAANNRIVILAGAGVNAKNVGEIVKKTGVKEVHGSASTTVKSMMVAQTSTSASKGKSSKRGSKSTGGQVKMGATDDSVIKVTDSQLVAQIVKNSRRC